jgi:hypothetical protein
MSVSEWESLVAASRKVAEVRIVAYLTGTDGELRFTQRSELDRVVDRVAAALLREPSVQRAVSTLASRLRNPECLVDGTDVAEVAYRTGIPIHDLTSCRCMDFQPGGARMVPDWAYEPGYGWTCPFVRGDWT